MVSCRWFPSRRRNHLFWYGIISAAMPSSSEAPFRRKALPGCGHADQSSPLDGCCKAKLEHPQTPLSNQRERSLTQSSAALLTLSVGQSRTKTKGFA